MRFTTRSFLLRRRIDGWLLLAGAVSLPLRISLSAVAMVLFSCIGVYLVAIRHRSVRLFSNRFQLFAVLYAIWSCGLILWRSDDPLGDRQLGYSLLFALFAFAGPGMVLIARPMRMFVLGSRIGVVLALAAALALSAHYGGRIGLGGNQAVFAFVVGVAILAATISVDQPPRWLPNGPLYLIVGTAIVLLSETRSVMAVIPIFAMIEIVIALRKYSSRAKIGIGVAVFVVLVGVAPQAEHFIHHRISPMIKYYSGLSDHQDTSGKIRRAMWNGALDVIAEHPITGVGSAAKMDAVNAKLSAENKLSDRFIHVHNSFLDELLNHGVIGLSLMLAALVSAIGFIWRHNAMAGAKRNLAYFVGLILAFGMLHNPFLHESMLGAIFLYIGVFHASISRRRAVPKTGVGD